MVLESQDCNVLNVTYRPIWMMIVLIGTGTINDNMAGSIDPAFFVSSLLMSMISETDGSAP